MSNIIKCPICHEMAGLRYNENRVYQSRCQNMECRETITVTAPSWKVAEDLFSKFEKGAALPKLSIPKWVADVFDEFLKDDYDWYDFEMSFVGVDDNDEGLERKFFDWTNSENATELTLAYLNPLTRPFVEVSDE